MSDKVVCYTLSYEICAKLYPKMIVKEVDELRDRANRIYERQIKDLNSKAAKNRLAIDSESFAQNDLSVDVESRYGQSESPQKTPTKNTNKNLAADSDVKLLGNGSIRSLRKSARK